MTEEPLESLLSRYAEQARTDALALTLQELREAITCLDFILWSLQCAEES